MTEAIKRHTPEDFDGMRRAGYLAARVLDYIGDFVDVGVSTERLNQLCHDYIIQHGAIPAPLNYKGFPKSICTSVNHVVCHGIPSPDKILQNGDIINIDVTVIVNGWHGDTSRMYTVGKAKGQARKLVEVTYECLMRGIDQVKPGARLGDIGYVIQSYAESFGFSVVRDFCGHGIGKIFHAAPSVLHYGNKGEGTRLEEGMFFTIEPMINVGTWRIKVLSDGWTAITQDRKLSAQFEHTLGVTSNGHEIFTV